MHADVLRSTGDPSSEESIAEALELLDAEPPGPELVAAHAGLAAMRLLGSSYEEAISAGARALALAAELALPEPARALGYRGAARCCLGDRDGLSDMRRAIQLAIEQGQGRAAAALHNNLAASIWDYEGPQAALESCRDGIDFCERRGVTEGALLIAAMSTTLLAEVGQAEQALAEAGPLAERLLADDNVTFTEPRIRAPRWPRMRSPRVAPSSPRRLEITPRPSRLTPRRPSAGASSETFPSAPTPCSGRLGAR